MDYVNGTGDYKGKGLSASSAPKAGKAKIDMKQFPKDTDALSALLGGQVDAYFADSPVAGYYTIQHPDAVRAVGAHRSASPRTASASRRTSRSCRRGRPALLSKMVTTGRTSQILQKYGLEDGATRLSTSNGSHGQPMRPVRVASARRPAAAMTAGCSARGVLQVRWDFFFDSVFRPTG